MVLTIFSQNISVKLPEILVPNVPTTCHRYLQIRQQSWHGFISTPFISVLMIEPNNPHGSTTVGDKSSCCSMRFSDIQRHTFRNDCNHFSKYIDGSCWHGNASTLLALYEENLTKSRQCGALMFYLLLDWVSCWTNSNIADNFRFHGTHLSHFLFLNKKARWSHVLACEKRVECCVVIYFICMITGVERCICNLIIITRKK